jgi:hypothetical protein
LQDLSKQLSDERRKNLAASAATPNYTVWDERFDSRHGSSFGRLRWTAPTTAATNPGRPFSAIFYGDSLTSFWDLSKSFPGSPYTNDGVFGATAVTLASDFGASVSPAHPGTVMMLAGTNDVLQGDTPVTFFLS